RGSQGIGARTIGLGWLLSFLKQNACSRRGFMIRLSRCSGEASMTDTALLDRDEVIAEALASGRSTRAITKELRVTTAELDAALERLFPIDTQARVRMIKSDLAQINRLTEIFFLKAVAGDVQAGTLTVKIWERKHELLGLDAVQRIDLQIINPPQEVPRHEKIRQVIERLTGRQLNDGNGPPLDDDSAVDELSPSNRD